MDSDDDPIDDQFLPELWSDDEFLASLPVQSNYNPVMDLSADKIKIWLDRVHKILAEDA